MKWISKTFFFNLIDTSLNLIVRNRYITNYIIHRSTTKAILVLIAFLNIISYIVLAKMYRVFQTCSVSSNYTQLHVILTVIYQLVLSFFGTFSTVSFLILLTCKERKKNRENYYRILWDFSFVCFYFVECHKNFVN